MSGARVGSVHCFWKFVGFFFFFFRDLNNQEILKKTFLSYSERSFNINENAFDCTSWTIAQAQGNFTTVVIKCLILFNILLSSIDFKVLYKLQLIKPCITQ